MIRCLCRFVMLVGLVAAAVFAAFGLGATAFAQQSQPRQPLVEKFVLSDTIQPVSASQLDRAIAQANSDGAQALLIELDTPGGLLDSMRSMIGAILASKVPVIVYVAPGGSRAGSAGFYLLESADVAAMAPATNAGAAHVVSEFGKMDDTMSQKVENDTEALLRSYVKQRGRNPDAAVAAAATSHSYTAQEALDQHLIDLIAAERRVTAGRARRPHHHPYGWQQAYPASGRRARLKRCSPPCAKGCSAGW